MPATRVAEPQTVESTETPDFTQPLGVAEYTPPAPEPQVVAPTTKNAKVKGTWNFVYGAYKQSFQDGHRYDLPLDVYEYLRRNGCIYDTL